MKRPTEPHRAARLAAEAAERALGLTLGVLFVLLGLLALTCPFWADWAWGR